MPQTIPDLARTDNIYCVGRNYVEHIEELGNQQPAEPIVFSKNVSSMTHLDYLEFPEELAPIHHELELVLRIDREVPRGAFRDLSCVGHMTLGLDFTARGLQDKLKAAGLPWFLAKNFQHACFVGSFREVDPNRHFHFELLCNGSPRQKGDSQNMIFSFHRILSFINKTLPLLPGDLVFTGTPSGVGPVADGDVLGYLCPELDLAGDLVITFKA